ESVAGVVNLASGEVNLRVASKAEVVSCDVERCVDLNGLRWVLLWSGACRERAGEVLLGLEV
ncbi:hypothetical protein C7A09_28275, partial [Pseudomonas fluorescens]